MPVSRAIATTKMHYLSQLQGWLRQKECDRPLEGHRFYEAYPDLSPASGGTLPMTEVGWRAVGSLKVNDGADYIKHVLTKHEGEAKFVGDEQWQEFSPDSCRGERHSPKLFLGVSVLPPASRPQLVVRALDGRASPIFDMAGGRSGHAL